MSAVITVVLVVGGLLAVLVVLSRSANRRKKEAQADLEREKAELQTPDIFELIAQEAADTGVEEIPGADGVEISTRLRVWHRDENIRALCPDPADLRFEVTPGMEPEDVTEDDLILTFDGAPEPEPPPEAAEETDGDHETDGEDGTPAETPAEEEEPPADASPQ